MRFIGNEVEAEEKIKLATDGFGFTGGNEKMKKVKPQVEGARNIPTAMGLVNTKQQKAQLCIFCNGDHLSSGCERARKMAWEEKHRLVKEKNCCYNCLKNGHGFKQCRAQIKCAWCSRRHLMIMCRSLMSKEPEKSNRSVKSEKTPPVENNLASFGNVPEIYLMTMKVVIRNGDQQREVRVLIDSASQNSYIKQSEASAIGYTVEREEEIVHTLFGGVKTASQKHNVYRLHLLSLEGNYACSFEARGQGVICADVPTINFVPEKEVLAANNVILTDMGETDQPISVLIGADIAGKLLTGRMVEMKCGLVAIETLLGWTVIGKVPQAGNQRVDVTLTAISLSLQSEDVTKMWDLEAIGISESAARITKEEREERVREHFLQTVKVNEEKRYEVELPWAEDHTPIASNKKHAEKRLQVLTNKLQNDGYFLAYDTVLKEWLQEGIVEQVPVEQEKNGEYYLTHRHVVTESKTTKLRAVFDASAKTKVSPSLNQCLETGPNLIELIPKILLGFRTGAFGVVADIKKAFLQISIAPKDRNVLKFLWWADTSAKEMIEFRHARVVFGVSCSPFLLAAVIGLHLQKMKDRGEYDADALQRLASSFYVDNCITSVETNEELVKFIEQSTTVMARANFVLRGWEFTGESDEKGTSVLGLMWNKERDSLYLNPAILEKPSPTVVTKRVILAEANRVFDPIGFTCPVLLCPKLLLQEAWLWGLDWDSEVDQKAKDEFLQWKEQLVLLKALEIPRRFLHSSTTNEGVSLHTFCDASAKAYATAVFFRVETRDGTKVYLVTAKSRVAPTKPVTIPRLELLAATIGARLTSFVVSELKRGDIPVYLWTDSSTVLTWIQRKAPWNVFVQNRVIEINQLVKPEDWRHLPGALNPADLPSRGCTARQLLVSQWWEGPKWLKLAPSDWPISTPIVDEDEVTKEKKKTTIKVNQGVALLTQETAVVEEVTWHSKLSKYSSMVRCVAWCKRFVRNCCCRRENRDRIEGPLSVDEVREGEIAFLKSIQREMFEGVADNRLKNLNAYLDKDGLIRLKSKIFNRVDNFNFRCPVVLRSDHHVVKRLAQMKHEELCHAGIQTTLNGLREDYWILSPRRMVRSVVKACGICQKQNAKRMEASTPPLPVNRVRDAAVFEVVGIDFAGPLYLKEDKKSWVVLYTCAVYRAVHLELVSSLSTNVFLGSLRRFVVRRGRPTTIYSDQGTNFIGAQHLFKDLDWDKVYEYGVVRKIQWIFNPPSAPWWGGWWERLIRLLKQLLRKILGKTSLTYEELLTVLMDCEAVINARPITYIGQDVNGLEPITPDMFLKELPEVGMPDFDNIGRESLCRKLRYKQRIMEDLRRRFRSEYLALLRFSNNSGRSTRQIQIGELVMIGDDNRKRYDWPLARVTEIFPGQDGTARVVKLKTTDGIVTRPIQRVYPLEMETNILNPEMVQHKLVEENEDFGQVMDLEQDEKSELDVREVQQITKSGRLVRKPKMLDL